MKRLLTLLAFVTTGASAAVVGYVQLPEDVKFIMTDVVGYCPVGVGMYTYVVTNDRISKGFIAGSGCWSKSGGRVTFYGEGGMRYYTPASSVRRPAR